MTREQIIAKWETLTPRERDAWMATTVMGWEVRKIYVDVVNGYFYNAYFVDGVFKEYTESSEFSPSTDMNDAWMVTTAIGDCLHLREHGAEGEWEASYCGLDAVGHGSTAPLAICLAALVAKLSDVSDGTF